MELDSSVLFGEVISVLPIGDSVVSVGVYVDDILPKAERPTSRFPLDLRYFRSHFVSC